MNALFRTGIVLFSALALHGPLTAGSDLRDELRPGNIDIVRVSLNPAGGGLGFETVIPGSDPRLDALLELIRGAEPGCGHKCPNAGTVRLRMQDGKVIGLGLLPSHTTGLYGFRLYDGEQLIAAYCVDRPAFLAAFSSLGVPTSDPAFRE